MAGPPFEPDEHFRVFVSSPLREERAVLQSLVRTLLWAGALAVALSFALISWTVRRGLRPVRQISAEIANVEADRLDRAINVAEVPTELAPIVHSFEATRERLAAAFTREKRFTSDAAHELRTPLAGLRASLEVALRRERSSDHYRSTIDECLSVTRSMEGMVETLLQLAKGVAGTATTESVDVSDWVKNAFIPYDDELERRRLTVQFTGDLDAIALCNGELAERIFANLASNAAHYADESSAIGVHVVKEPDAVSVRFSNRASDMAADVVEHAFEPLWRGDQARSDTNSHAGLGLSLVKQCADALPGSVTVHAANGRFEISVTLPV